MVTSKKFMKLLAAQDDKELETLINKMSEADAKGLLKTIIFQMNKERFEQAKAMGFLPDEAE